MNNRVSYQAKPSQVPCAAGLGSIFLRCLVCSERSSSCPPNGFNPEDKRTPFRAGVLGLTRKTPPPIHFTAPLQFGGVEGRWTPEDLLMTALASCFTTTFLAIAAYSKFEYTDLAVEAEGTVSKTDTGYGFNEIVIRPNLTIASEENRQRAIVLLYKAKALCLVSRTLATPQNFEIQVEIKRHSQV